MSKMEVKTCHVGAMLAHFSLLTHFFSFLDAYCALLWQCLAILTGFFALWRAQGSIFQGPGVVVQARKRHFSMLLCTNTHTKPKCSSCNKTTIFAMLYTLRNMSLASTERVFCIAFKALLDMVHGLLQKVPAGIHFLLFKTTLQRGGTCEAHGIGPIFSILGSRNLACSSFFTFLS